MHYEIVRRLGQSLIGEAEHFMLQFDLMQPHTPSPTSRKIDVDISDILLGPGTFRSGEISQEAAFGGAAPDQAESSPRWREDRVGPFGWISLNFVVVCTLIAVFCTIFIRDTFEYSRRNAHLPADAADLKPEFRSSTSPSVSLEAPRVAPGPELNRRQTALPEQSTLFPNQNREIVNPSQFRPDQPATPLPNNVGSVAGRNSINNSTATSSETSTPSRASRTTTSTSESSSSGEQSSSNHSTVRRTIRQPRKSISSTRKTISSRRQNMHTSGGTRSALHSARQNQNNLTFGSRHGQISAQKTQMGSTGNLMSMHSLGAGSAVRQTHGALNPMHMEGGLLAQPGIGAGLGGISGHGLGGGGGGNHGGARVAK